jgi:hypothetical protein
MSHIEEVVLYHKSVLHIQLTERAMDTIDEYMYVDIVDEISDIRVEGSQTSLWAIDDIIEQFGVEASETLNEIAGGIRNNQS